MGKQWLIKKLCGLASDTDHCVICGKWYYPLTFRFLTCEITLDKTLLTKIHSNSKVLRSHVFPPYQCSEKWCFQWAKVPLVQRCHCLGGTELYFTVPYFPSSLLWHRNQKQWSNHGAEIIMIPSVTKFYLSGHASQSNDVSKGSIFLILFTAFFNAPAK